MQPIFCNNNQQFTRKRKLHPEGVQLLLYDIGWVVAA